MRFEFATFVVFDYGCQIFICFKFSFVLFPLVFCFVKGNNIYIGSQQNVSTPYSSRISKCQNKKMELNKIIEKKKSNFA